MSFPTIVYKCPGQHSAFAGQTYAYSAARDEDELAELVKAGWHDSLVAAVNAVNGVSVEKVEDVDDESAPTRAELEDKARELGLKFDGRTSDAKLGRMIIEALGE
jgi:hypothetical protein